MRSTNSLTENTYNLLRPEKSGLKNFDLLRVIVGVIIAITIFSGLIYQFFGINMLDFMPKQSLCIFKAVTGKPCPGCGMTHAFIHISQFEFIKAFHENPFSIPFYLIMLIFLFTGDVPKILKSKIFKYFLFIAVILLWFIRLTR